MALVIEFVKDGRVSDGYETWWDDAEREIDQSPLDFPVLSRIDPVGYAEIAGSDLERADRELESLIPTSVSREDIDALIRLCRKARAEGALLRFRGD